MLFATINVDLTVANRVLSASGAGKTDVLDSNFSAIMQNFVWC